MKKHWTQTPAARRAASARMTAYWAEKRKLRGESLGQRVASDLPWSLTYYVVNGDGKHYVRRHLYAATAEELLPALLHGLFGKEDVQEYRLVRV